MTLSDTTVLEFCLCAHTPEALMYLRAAWAADPQAVKHARAQHAPNIVGLWNRVGRALFEANERAADCAWHDRAVEQLEHRMYARGLWDGQWGSEEVFGSI